MRAIFFLVVAAICWGLNFHLAKIMLQKVNFIEAGFWRYLFGVGVLLIFQLRHGLMSLYAISFKEYKYLLLVGLIGLFCFNLFFFLGLEYTNPLNAALIMSLNPIFTLLLAVWLLNGSINRQQKIGMAVALFGVVYLLTKGNPNELLELNLALGDLLILGANILFAFYHVWTKKYGAAFANSTFTFITNAFCLLAFLILQPFFGLHAVGEGSSSFWLAAIGIGVFGTGLAYRLWNAGVQEMGAEQAGVYINVVPLATAILSVFFGEHLEYYHGISGLLILGSILYLQMDRTANT